MDVQGADLPRGYAKKFGVTFTVAVDPADVFGRAFGLKAIPDSFLVDEAGIIRLHGNGPNAVLLEKVAAVLKEPLTTVRAAAPQLAAARTQAELEKTVAASPGDWRSRVALAQLLDGEGKPAEALAQLEAAAKMQPREPGVLFVWGTVLFRQNQKEASLAKLKAARDLDPENWRIRKQIWAIENPDKFYTGTGPDYGWQKKELAREKAAGHR